MESFSILKLPHISGFLLIILPINIGETPDYFNPLLSLFTLSSPGQLMCHQEESPFSCPEMTGTDPGCRHQPGPESLSEPENSQFQTVGESKRLEYTLTVLMT